MPLIIIAAGVALLLILMIGFKVNGFIALVLVAAVVGVDLADAELAQLKQLCDRVAAQLGR